MKEERTQPPAPGGASLDWPLDRRGFLKVLGGGIVILFWAGVFPAQAARPGSPGQELPTDFNAYLRIAPDGAVSCFTGKIEMGQGVITSLAQMLADELDLPLERVEMVMGDTDLCPWDGGTVGSRSIRFFGPPLREAAAEARAVLLALAAERLKVPEDRLAVADGVISDKRDAQRRVTYAQLAQGKAIARHLPAKATPKAVPQFKVMGKPYLRTDAVAKVTGRALYAGDIRFSGMLYAKILRPPAHGATLKRADTSAARNVPGALVVEEPGFIAVCHPLPDAAEKAILLVKAEWQLPESGPDNTTIHRHLMEAAPRTGEVIAEGGDPARAEKAAARLFTETYLDDYVAHAQIETHTATAVFDKGRLTIWPSSQSPFRAKDSVAQALAMDPDKVHVVMPFVGGGFGGKSFNLQAVEAARLAKLTGKPIQVMWNRREAFFLDTFRPASIIKIVAGMDNTGRIGSWRYDVYYAGPRGAEPLYAIDDHRETVFVHYSGAPGTHPFATGAWRSPGNNSNTFARESHIDTMAAAVGMDPLAFRLKNLSDPRMIATLKATAEKFGWISAAAPSGRGCGVACLADAGTCVAAMAEIEVNRATGAVAVRRIVIAQEMGIVINPEGARLQMEGGVTMGLGYALTEEVDFKAGRILNANFDTYKIPRFSWLPRIDTVLVDNPDVPPQGGGEPSIPSVGAVIANAIFDATGARLTRMPMTPARVKEALAAAGKGAK